MVSEIFVLVAIYGFRNVLGQGMGPLNVKLVNIESCDGNNGFLTMGLINLDDGEKGIDIDIDLPFALDEDVSYNSKITEIEDHKKELIIEHGGDNACTNFEKILGKVWHKAGDNLGFPKECPIPAGKYNTKAFPFDYKDLDSESFMYGKFILTLEIVKDGTVRACSEIEFTNDRPGPGL